MVIELGGDITLKGFSDLEGGELVVVKKIVGRYARKMTETADDYQGLTVTVKPVHKTEQNQKFELHAKMDQEGDTLNSEVTNENLFVGLDDVLSNIIEQI